MIDTVVFLGPSLPIDAARAILDADYRPPAQRGDVERLLGTVTRRILLIDGIFHGAPSIWQRELLAAIEDGIEVFGASSMGALRALEVAPYGMVGHGEVFEWYRDGIIDGDDEVALLHADASAGWRALSVPLVNIRATLARGCREELLSREETQQLILEAKQTFYPHRSLKRLANYGAVSWTPARRQEVVGALQTLYVDQKRLDAESLLHHCAERPSSNRRHTVRFHTPIHLVRARRIDRTRTNRDVLERARERGIAERLRRPLALRWYTMQWARDRGIVCPVEARVRLAAQHLPHSIDRDQWLADRRVTLGEYEAWLEERALVEWLIAEPDLLPGAPSDATGRTEAIARDWLCGWGIDSSELPDPSELDFDWSPDARLLVELRLSGVAATLEDKNE